MSRVKGGFLSAVLVGAVTSGVWVFCADTRAEEKLPNSQVTVRPDSSRVAALPPLRIVNRAKVSLEFDVLERGPSGLGSVDVYITSDEGATWEKIPTESATLRASTELRGSSPVTGSVSVQLPRDGVIYGLYLVVKSRAGLGQAPPRNGVISGDAPQLRVELDTTPPRAEMYTPQADPNRSDALILSWWAEDRNLAVNPISLEWSAQREGPWEFIGEVQLPNTGRFTWNVPQRIPPKVFLRLTARDTAGNTAVAQTPDPIMIDLVKPRVAAVRLKVMEPDHKRDGEEEEGAGNKDVPVEQEMPEYER